MELSPIYQAVLVVKNCRREGVGVKNHKNLPTSSMDGPLSDRNMWYVLLSCGMNGNLVGRNVFFLSFSFPRKDALNIVDIFNSSLEQNSEKNQTKNLKIFNRM
jgi:hypothetical protein